MTFHQHRALIVALTSALAVLLLALVVLVVDGAMGNRLLQRSSAGLDRRDFALIDQDRHPVTLESFRGKWLLMFFGYTSCPDICPTTLANMTDTVAEMGEAANSLQLIYVTIDPERDTPETLKSYLENFGGHVVGLTGRLGDVAAVAKRYGVYFQRVATNDGSYLMDHSAGLMLVSPEGEYIRVYRPDEDPKDFAAQLLSAMNKSQGPKQ